MSVDSTYSHANWASSMGGISFPLLADFHPKGGLCESFGLWIADHGIGDRATVIIDREGIVRFAHSVGPPGRRNIADLAAECEKFGGDPLPAGGSASGTLYVKNSCGPSRAAKLAVENLHQTGNLTIKNVSDDAAAKVELVAAGGKDQTPCLVVDGHATYESADIVSALVAQCAPLP